MMRIGFGYDIHRLEEGRRLFLGGVRIPDAMGAQGHSDADVLIHAIIDSLLGAASLGDIGEHFPPSDPAYRDISSRVLLKQTVDLLTELGWILINIDTTVILEKPKLSPFRRVIQDTLSQDLCTAKTNIGVKAKTKEGADATGQGRTIEAYAVCLLQKYGDEEWV